MHILNGCFQLVLDIVLLTCGLEPIGQDAWAWVYVLNNCLQQFSIEAIMELSDGANVI